MEFPNPPQGYQAIPWRIPIWFFRLGLGWVFGTRALLLNHAGRVTGKNRQAVLEIIHHSPESSSFTVVSGFGPKSNWYKNITANPNVEIQVGRKRMKAIAKELRPDQAETIFLDYVEKFPNTFRSLANILGYNIEHTPEGYQSFGRQIPIIRFTSQPEK
jgi:deazaflavin-dependent oxidoreductase (nitroreductase family)